MITGKIQPHHTSKQAYVYLRQSTTGQVQFNQESTQRQYALQNKAQQMGWPQAFIRILDGDLGISGTSSANREDFKTLVADVSMGKVGAVFALEVSRLSRSGADWHRLLELCAMTDTLIIDEDGCYNLSDFNDQMILNFKGTMSQAEIHYIRARLEGGKMHKAKKGDLKFALPIGFCHDEKSRIRLDPDEQVQNTVRLIFNVFKEKGSAYGIVRHFAQQKIQFPKRACGGVWKGKLTWGKLTECHATSILKNPSYAGVYVYGRRKNQKKLSETGQLQSSTVILPMDSWLVMIKDHHEGYISWEDYMSNQVILEQNSMKRQENMLPLNAREGLALLQGLLLCGGCGRQLYTHYKGNGGIYPTYQCQQQAKDSATNKCVLIGAKCLDHAISDRILMAIKPEQIKIAIKAFEELEQRSQSLEKQWLMKIERAKYESQLAQRRYQEVDPSNRLVAGTLEKDWNDTLISLQEVMAQYEDYRKKNILTVAKDQKENLLNLAKDFPRLWNAPSTSSKDRKRIVRLFIKDITVEKFKEERKAVLHIRWQGGGLEDLEVPLLPLAYEKWKHPDEIINRIRELSLTMSDRQISEKFSQEGLKTKKGYSFTRASICSVRLRCQIPVFSPEAANSEELSVSQVAAKFNVGDGVVRYWIKCNRVNARLISHKFWILLDSEKEAELKNLVERSNKIGAVRAKSQTQF
jgi:DNA invertase Pin-like site-specific DNA recombinase